MHARWLAVVVLLTGCSFVHARAVNDLRGCSRTPEHIDLAIAGATAITAGAVGLAVRCDVTDASCDETSAVFFVIGPALVVGVAALASAFYGADIADGCEMAAMRANSSRVR